MRIVSTFKDSTTVVQSLKCSLSEGSEHLIVAHPNRLIVYRITPKGLTKETEFRIWGRVVSLKAVLANVSNS